MEKTYRIEGLDCANCAAGLERELCKVPGVRSLNIDFMAQLIRADLEDSRVESAWELIQKVTAIMHPECTVAELEEAPAEEQTGERNYRAYQPREKEEFRIGFFHRGWIEPILSAVLLAAAAALTAFCLHARMGENSAVFGAAAGRRCQGLLECRAQPDPWPAV